MNKHNELALKLDTQVATVIGNKNLEGFQKAYMVAEAIDKLKVQLTTEYMKPIMALQGQVLGFRTDKDRDGGYSEQTVKSCLIDAVLFGLQPVGNQFNIISGNMYPTKEGLGYLLKNTEGLSYEIVPMIPKLTSEQGIVTMQVRWTYNGVSNERNIDFAIKVNRGMGADAVIGKATRKARAWLYNTINNTEIVDGEVSDLPNVKVVELTEDDIEAQMELESKVLSCDTLEALEALWNSLSSEDKGKYKLSFSNRKKDLTNGHA